MTPISTSDSTISRIEVLEARLKKQESKFKFIKFIRQKKIKDTKERLQLNWDRLYDFYPEMCAVKDIAVFRNLLSSGVIPNKMRKEVYNSKIYTVGSKEWRDYLDSGAINESCFRI